MSKSIFYSCPLSMNLALLTLRGFAGTTMLLSHGWGKAMKLASGDTGFADVFGMGEPTSLVLAVFAEVVCAAFLALGLFTRISAIPLMVTMAVAAFVIHADDPFGDKEMALFYLVSFTAIFLSGPGKYSIDYLIKRV